MNKRFLLGSSIFMAILLITTYNIMFKYDSVNDNIIKLGLEIGLIIIIVISIYLWYALKNK